MAIIPPAKRVKNWRNQNPTKINAQNVNILLENTKFMPNQNKQEEWKIDLNNRFFAGIPMEDMGSNQVSEETLQNFIESLLHQEREKAVREKEEILEALEGMYYQYCDGGHSFMSAGERAELVLEKYTDNKFGDAGEILPTNKTKE